MDIFQRSIHSNVKKTGDTLRVTSSLLDLEHSFHLEMVVEISTATIRSARASMSKVPLARCLGGVDTLPRLEGLRIGRGIIAEVNQRLGGPRGCAHLVELITDAIRLVSMLLIGDSVGYWAEMKETMSEEEIVAAGRKQLRNTCFVFAEDPAGASGRSEGEA